MQGHVAIVSAGHRWRGDVTGRSGPAWPAVSTVTATPSTALSCTSRDTERQLEEVVVWR